MRHSSVEIASITRSRIGAIRSAVGSIVVSRPLVTAFPDCHTDAVYTGDEIATGEGSAATIGLRNGSRIRLSASTCVILDRPEHRSEIAAVSLSKTCRRSEPHRGKPLIDAGSDGVRGGHRARRSIGLRILSFAVAAYALLRDIERTQALTTDNDTITPRDSEYGRFEIITKAGTVILVDDPALTYIVDEDGSVERRVNSSARMEELQAAQQAVLGTLMQGFAAAPGSGSPQDSPGVLDLQPLTIPINFRPLDPVPERIIAPVLTAPLEERPFIPPPPAPPAPPSPPVITTFTFDSGIAGDRITNNNVLTLIGTATPGTVVSIYDAGTLLGSTTADGNGTWSFETGPLSDGEHAFAAAAGAPTNSITARSAFSALAASVAPSPASGPASATYIVIIDTQAPDAPVISVNSDGPPENSASDTTPTLTIAAEPSSIVHIYRDGKLAGTAIESETPGIFIFESDALPDGRYTFTATATDVANNTSRPSCYLTIEIDATAPFAPEFIKLLDPYCCGDDTVTDDSTPAMLIAAEAGSTVRIYRDGIFVGTATETGKAGLFTYTSPELTDGKYVFTAAAADSAANLGPLSDPFSIAVITSDPNDFDEMATGQCITVTPDGSLHGTRHDDFIRFGDDDCEPGRTIYSGAGQDDIKGTNRDDVIYAGSGNDKVFGDRGNDLLFGGTGNDKIDGGKGHDIIAGGYGADYLAGGTGCDTFVFLSAFHSVACARDVIADFNRYQDKIDLSAIDADAGRNGDQAFIFAGQTSSYDVTANGLTWYYDWHSDRTIIVADTDGDTRTAELEISLSGKVTLTHDNFVL